MEKIQNMSDEDKEFQNQIDFFYKRAYLDDRIIRGDDLPEILMGPPILNTEVFVATAEDDSDSVPQDIQNEDNDEDVAMRRFKRKATNSS